MLAGRVNHRGRAFGMQNGNNGLKVSKYFKCSVEITDTMSHCTLFAQYNAVTVSVYSISSTYLVVLLSLGSLPIPLEKLKLSPGDDIKSSKCLVSERDALFSSINGI